MIPTKFEAIDYRFVAEAFFYYSKRGYEHVEAPWVVSKDAINATCPTSGNLVTGDTFVASGEQSFLEMIRNGKLEYAGLYQCATPCYRPWDKDRSPIHHEQFFKVELIFTHGENIIDDDSVYDEQYAKITNDALEFFRKFVPNVEIVPTTDDPRFECRTIVSSDIMTKEGMELGSYGIRTHPKFGSWVYGTGVALPRLQTAINDFVAGLENGKTPTTR